MHHAVLLVSGTEHSLAHQGNAAQCLLWHPIRWGLIFQCVLYSRSTILGWTCFAEIDFYSLAPPAGDSCQWCKQQQYNDQAGHILTASPSGLLSLLLPLRLLGSAAASSLLVVTVSLMTCTGSRQTLSDMQQALFWCKQCCLVQGYHHNNQHYVIQLTHTRFKQPLSIVCCLEGLYGVQACSAVVVQNGGMHEAPMNQQCGKALCCSFSSLSPHLAQPLRLVLVELGVSHITVRNGLQGKTQTAVPTHHRTCSAVALWKQLLQQASHAAGGNWLLLGMQLQDNHDDARLSTFWHTCQQQSLFADPTGCGATLLPALPFSL